MKPSEPSPGGVAAALALAARAQPEAPFLFYRNARGQFRWWSFSQASAFLDHGGRGVEKPPAEGVAVEREAVDVLGPFLQALLADSAVLPGAPASAVAGERDIWICRRPLTEPTELAMARWAVRTGAAILVEPSPVLHPELVAWARPTLVSGSAEELLGLADGLEALAPRFLRRRWFRQRSARLRQLIVDGPAGADDLERVAARWRGISPEFAPRVVRMAADSLV